MCLNFIHNAHYGIYVTVVTFWKLKKFSLTLFWEKFRESNSFTKYTVRHYWFFPICSNVFSSGDREKSMADPVVPNISRKKHILHKQNQIHTNATCLSKVTEINNSANSPYFLILYGTTKCKLLIIYHHRMKLENHVLN